MARVVDRPHSGPTPGDADETTSLRSRLQRLERQVAEVQRLAEFGSWEWDIGTDVVTWSDELWRIYGLAPGEFPLTFESSLDRVHPGDRGMVNDAVRRAIADGASYALDHRLVRPDGDVLWLHARGNVVAAGQERTPQLYGVAIDITQRKQSDEFLRDFIGNASHALRTPAAVISQVAGVLADQMLAVEDRDAAMGALTRQAQRLHDLTTNLFDLVALDAAAPSVMLGLSMMIRPVPLADKVRSAVAASPPGAGARLSIDIGADIMVLAEPTELERVFVNLFTNARTHGGPNVTVTASRLADQVIVEVVDDGPGVPDDYLASLFAPFSKRRMAGQGAGLGLAVVHQLMAAFGGSISYHRAEPHGSVFSLRFVGD